MVKTPITVDFNLQHLLIFNLLYVLHISDAETFS